MAYYFVITSLPPLILGTAAEISFEEFQRLVRLNIYKKNSPCLQLFYTYINIRNMRAFWLEEPFDPRGTLSEKEMEESLLVRTLMPPFVFDFLDRYESTQDRLRYFADLYANFFRYAIGKGDGFIHKYFSLEREVRLIVTALRANLFKKDIVKEMQFEDPKDPFIAHILAQKDMQTYDPPKEYERLKGIFEEFQEQPSKLALAFLEFTFEKIAELEENYPPFSIDAVLGYMVRLYIWENWHKLDETQGKTIVDLIA